MATIEFFYDCSSPWTYLAFHRVQPLADELGSTLEWRPILVGGVFNSINPSVYVHRENPVPAKERYARKDLADWARDAGLEIRWPSVFPVNSVKAMRGALVAGDQGRIVDWSRKVFEAYWRDDLDISRDEVLERIAEGVDLDPASLLAAIADPAIKERLRANTDELIARGGFGSPTLFVDRDDMYFGNDRLPLVRSALERRVRG